MLRSVFSVGLVLSLFHLANADETKGAKQEQGPMPRKADEFRTVETAITTKIQRNTSAGMGQTGYLGISVDLNEMKELRVEAVQSDSPAAAVGIKIGDLILQIDNEKPASSEQLRILLQSKNPGEKLKIRLRRGMEEIEATATLGATSRPVKQDGPRAIAGLRVGERNNGETVVVEQVTPDLPASKAGLKVGDVLLKWDGRPLMTAFRFTDLLADKKPNDVVSAWVQRDGKELELKIKLIAEPTITDRFRNWDDRPASLWRNPKYRLAVVGIEYSDVKHNPKITNKDWTDSLFSKSTYTKTSATGSKVYGSMNDYYQEQSLGALRIEGKMFDWVEVSKKRADYAPVNSTSNKSVLLIEALDKLFERDGKDALKDFDGIFFLYAGERVSTNRGSLYWPHRASFTHQGKRWSYFIVPEGGSRMGNISVICHEFGHMLGLLDLYARPENPGSEGLGGWCAMSNQNGNGRPQHFSAWPKEQLGWITPAVINPTVKQKLILSPIEDSAKECYKVLIRPDGSEYLLLENRRKKGFDTDLPGEGLLIWRVVQNKVILEESHGVDGPAGPRVNLSSVPYPSANNNSYTPYTTPSSRSQLGGGYNVHITNITRMPDGKISFYIGYEFE